MKLRQNILLGAFIVVLVIIAASVMNSPWFWNVHAGIFKREQFRLPITKLILFNSDRGQMEIKDLGPGVFTIALESNGINVRDGSTQEVKVFLQFENDGMEREIIATGTVYNGTFSSKVYTFSRSYLQAKRDFRIGLRWEPNTKIDTVVFNVRRAH